MSETVPHPPAPTEPPVFDDLRRILDEGRGKNPQETFDRLSAVVLGLQRHLLAKRLERLVQSTVQSGPFAGMHYVPSSSGSAFPPKLLGSYEMELHGAMTDAIHRGYARVINIGCGEGYYAVGLARLMPGAEIFAFETDSAAQKLCAQLAQINGVGERVKIAGGCNGATLQQLIEPDGRTLIVCDCEGCELTVLDMQAAPKLETCDLIVEMHDFLDPTISAQLIRRFAFSHDIHVIEHGHRDPRQYPVLKPFSEYEQLMLMCEFRPGPTPWAVMIARDEQRKASV